MKWYANDDEWFTYATDIIHFLDQAQIPKDKVLWCPFDDENSNFVKVLKEQGYKVVYSHISQGKDFYTYVPEHFDLIISNPPFKNKYNTLARLIELDKPFALIYGTQCFTSSKFTKLLKSVKSLSLCFLIKRLKFFKKGETTSKSPPFQSMWITSGIFKNQVEIF